MYLKNQINLSKAIFSELQLDRNKSDTFNKDEILLNSTLDDKQKLLFENIRLGYQSNQSFRDQYVVKYVLNYISRLCSTSNDIFFD